MAWTMLISASELTIENLQNLYTKNSFSDRAQPRPLQTSYRLWRWSPPYVMSHVF